MSTNYYLRSNPCQHCGRGDDDVHICQNMTGFEAVFDGDADTVRISTWAQWRDELRLTVAAGSTIVDEYGGFHDVETFIAAVEATDPAARRRQYDWCATHGQPIGVGRRSTWLDPDGFTFYGGEFA